jgi:hypothetical protein
MKNAPTHLRAIVGLFSEVACYNYVCARAIVAAESAICIATARMRDARPGKEDDSGNLSFGF